MRTFAVVALASLVVFSNTSRLRGQLTEDSESRQQDAPQVDHYGDPLPEGANARMGTIRLRHGGRPHAVAFSPVGQFIASAGSDHPVMIWDAATGRPAKALRARINRGNWSLAFSPDGTRLACGADGGRVTLWDIESASELWTNDLHSGRVYGAAFAPDGHTCATADGDGTVIVWDVATGANLLQLRPTASGRNFAFALAYSADSSLLACGSGKSITIYNLEDGTEAQTIRGAHGREIFSLEFTPDGQHLLSAGQSAMLVKLNEQGERVGASVAETRLWRVADGRMVRNFGKPEEGTSSSSAALTKDGKHVVAVMFDRIQVWDVESGEDVRTISEYHNSFGARNHSVAISPDAKTAVTVGSDHAIMLWDLETGERRLPYLDSHEGRIMSIAWSPDGTLVASGAYDGTVRIWDGATGEYLRCIEVGKGSASSVNGVAFSPDGKHIAAGGDDLGDRINPGVIGVWNVRDGESVWRIVLPERVTAVAYSPDGKKLAASAGLGAMFPRRQETDPAIYTWDAATAQRQEKWTASPMRITLLAFSDDGSTILATDEQRMLHGWSVESHEKLDEVAVPGDGRRLNSAAFTRDRLTIAASDSRDDTVRVLDAATGNIRRAIKIENTEGSFVAIAPRGNLLASACIGLYSTNEKRYDQSIHVWKPDTGEELCNFDQGKVAVTALEFSPDGDKLVAGLADGTLLLWDTQRDFD